MRPFDLCIIGGGPAGLGAAVHAASDGLRTVVLCGGPRGGQVSGSMAIENYPGIPEPVTGPALAERMLNQAIGFGAEFRHDSPVRKLRRAGASLVCECGDPVRAKAVLVATGLSARDLPLAGIERLRGRFVFGHAVEGVIRSGHAYVVLGGGNSAGQTALYLAGRGCRVYLIHRRRRLEETMSSYLTRRIAGESRIVVLGSRNVRDLEDGGDVCLVLLDDGSRLECRALFNLIGGVPDTDWLPDAVKRDKSGFVVTDDRRRTTMDGVYCAGDVRAGAVRRAAAAVGDGVAAVGFVQQDRNRRRK